MNNVAYWNWTIQGAEGCLSMMESIIKDKGAVTVEQLDKLLKLQARLEAVIDQADKNVENR